MKEILERLAEENPDVVTWDGFDAAVVGIGCRCSKDTLVVYDYDKMVRILMKHDKMDHEEAVEFLDFNVVGAWVGKHTPIILYRR